MVTLWGDSRLLALSDVMMALIARVYRSDPDERRGAERYPLEVGATLRRPEGEPIDVLIYDLSLTGFRMETPEALDLEEPVWIGIAGTRVNTALVARRGPTGYGCEFVTPITLVQLKAVLSPGRVVHELEWREEELAWPEDDSQFDSTAGKYWLALWLVIIVGGAFALGVLSQWLF
ncbi:MAG: PilZ domain-containing protein [Sphingomonas sp.]